MQETLTISVSEAREIVSAAMIGQGTAPDNAASVADALVAAEVDGQAGHGLSRVASYAVQVASGKVDGRARPVILDATAVALRIDAANGFAYPALDLARHEVCGRASDAGIAVATICRSHHFGQAGYQVERVAGDGLIGLLFGNSPKAIAPWGGSSGVFGTNPIACAFPRGNAPPLVIDLSLSKVARGQVMVAAREGRPIPEGIALDSAGNPTTDATAALDGTMVPMGGAKGYPLVLMVEILSAALAGANFGFEASSYFTPDGPPPGVGQTLLAFEPDRLSGGRFFDRLEVLIDAILSQDGTRLPGSRLAARRQAAEQHGITVRADLLSEIRALAPGERGA